MHAASIPRRIDMHSILCNRNGRILLGGMQEKMVEYDLTTGRGEFKQIAIIVALSISVLLISETRVEQLDGGTCAILRLV